MAEIILLSTQENVMNTYIAKVESSSGTQTIKLAAANLQDAQGQIAARTQPTANESYSYSITQTSPIQSPEFIKGIASASGSLLACLILFVVIEYMLRKWLKG
jgi:hypothetical protein